MILVMIMINIMMKLSLYRLLEMGLLQWQLTVYLPVYFEIECSTFAVTVYLERTPVQYERALNCYEPFEE